MTRGIRVVALSDHSCRCASALWSRRCSNVVGEAPRMIRR